MTDPIRTVSKKKILFIQLDEELPSVLERVEKLPYKEIYLVVPRRAVLLQSIVNLNILKQKLEELDKTLALITNDPNGMKLALQADVRVFDQWSMEADGEANPSEGPKEKRSELLRPIAATQNEVDEILPARLPRKKASIFEVIRELRHKDHGFSLRRYLADLKKNRLERDPIRITPGRKKWIALFLSASIVVLFVVVYIALPGATVVIEPTSDVVTRGVNVIVTASPSNERDLKAYPLESDVELSLSLAATGIENRGTEASGMVTLINVSETARPLIASTRVQSPEGLVFRIQSDVTVPAGTPQNPGKLEVKVVADKLDAGGKASGVRGNLGPTRFFLPGLKEDSRAELYAESTTPMTGGTSDVITRVSEEDFKAAQAKLEAALSEKALAELRKEALELGNQKGTELSVLEDDTSVQIGTPEVELPLQLLGQEASQFEVKGHVHVSGIAYDREALYELLKKEMVSAQTPGKQLVSVDEDSISLRVLDTPVGSGNYKVTAQIQGVEEFAIDPELKGGSELSQRIKEHIAGKKVAEAEAYIQNLPEVNSVDIQLWPLWSPTIPSLPENIRIKSLSKGGEL